MKYDLTLTLFVGCVLFSCASEKRVELDFSNPELTDSTGLVLFEEEPFNGLGFTLNDSGLVQTETRYVDGKRNGEHNCYSSTGELLFTAEYRNDEKHGDWREYLDVESNSWEDYWSQRSTHYRDKTYENGSTVGLTKVYRIQDSTLFKVYTEATRSDGQSCYIDTVYEYFSSGALAAATYYPDSSNSETYLVSYFENGNVEYRIQKHQHVPARYRRMLRELKQANKKYNLNADLSAFSLNDSVVLKVISYEQFNEAGRRINNMKGSPALEEAYSMLEDYLPLLQLQELTGLFGGGGSSYFGSSSSSSTSYGSSSSSSRSSACSACNRSFNFKEWKGKAHGWSNFKESRPGYVKCGNCDGYGFTDEYHHSNYANPTTRHRCTNSRCQNGWLVCNSCYGKGSH